MTCGLQRRVRALTLSIVTVASLGGAISTAVAGDLVHPIQFAIPAQPLDSALRALARQADIQILFAPSVAVGSMAPAITGEMSARKALELLLSSTPLEFTVQDEDTIIVRQKTAHESPRKPTPASSSGAAQVPDTAALQEIVVTAQKRSESLSKTPLAVSALSQENLTAAGVTGIKDLVAAVPNTEVRTVGFANAVQLTVRGISNSDFSEDSDPAIATYVDGIYIARTQGLNGSLYDLERVEVLRGPQGTLYGRNATGGNLNIVTATPKSTPEASADVSYGNYGDFQTHGMVNVPLTEQLAIRAAVVSHRSNGYFNTLGTTVRNYAASDDYGARFTALWTPLDAFTWRLAAENFTSHGTPGMSIDTGVDGKPLDGLPVFRRPVTSSPEPVSDIRNWLFRSRMEYRITDAASLAYIAGYQQISSTDAGDFSGTASAGFDGSRNVRGQTLQHELDLDFDHGPVHNILGASYFHQLTYEKDAYHLYYVDFSFTGGAKNQLDRAWGVFDQLTYSVLDSLRITGGVRYSSEYKDRTSHFFLGCAGTTVPLDSMLAVPAFAPPGTALPPGCTYTYDGFVPNVLTGAPQRRNWSNVNWKAGLDYDLTDSTMAYMNVTTGFKAGGLQNAAVGSVSYDPETVTNYELGIKARPLHGRATLNAALFYEDYKNLQVTQIYGSGANISTATSNAAKAAIYGLELEGRWRLTPVDNLSGFANYLHATYKEYPDAVDQQFSANAGDLSGRSLPRAPRVSLRIAYDHELSLPNKATLTPMVSVYWQSSSYLREFNFPVDRVDSYSKTNVNLSYLDATGHWTVAGYVDNAENKVTRNGAFTFLGHYFSDYQPPRTFGIRLSYQP